MNSSGQPEAWELADYWRVLRRRWWVVVLLACVGLAIAEAAVKVLPKSYTASATVSVTALPLDTRALPEGCTIDMDNAAQLVQSREVARLAATSLRYTAPTSALSTDATVTVPTLEGRISLKVPPGSAVGRTLRVRERGVKRKDGRGDLLVTLELAVPSRLSAEATEALDAYARATAGDDPRARLMDRAEAGRKEAAS